MQSIFTFPLRRFHNKQVYGCDQNAKGFFSYCEAYFIVIKLQKFWCGVIFTSTKFKVHEELFKTYHLYSIIT